MARTIAVKENGEWDLFNVKIEVDAVNQDITTKLLEIINDCWFNVDAGLDFELISTLPRAEAQSYLDDKIPSLILQVVGVQEILTFTSTLINSTYSLNFTFRYNNEIQTFENNLEL